MYTITKFKVIYYYNYFNKTIFHNHLPNIKDIHIIIKNYKNPTNWAESWFYKNKYKNKYFFLCFKTKKFTNQKLFLNVLLHEMIHLLDALENGEMTGHGKEFMKWRLKLLTHGFLLKKYY